MLCSHAYACVRARVGVWMCVCGGGGSRYASGKTVVCDNDATVEAQFFYNMKGGGHAKVDGHGLWKYVCTAPPWLPVPSHSRTVSIFALPPSPVFLSPAARRTLGVVCPVALPTRVRAESVGVW